MSHSNHSAQDSAHERSQEIESEHEIGLHHVEVRADSIWVRVQGPLSVAQTHTLTRIYEVKLVRTPRIYSVLDVTRGVAPSAEVRKVMADWRRHHHVAGSAVIGASRPIRVVATLYLRAARLLGLRTWPVELVESDAEAHAFLAQLRAGAS